MTVMLDLPSFGWEPDLLLDIHHLVKVMYKKTRVKSPVLSSNHSVSFVYLNVHARL